MISLTLDLESARDQLVLPEPIEPINLIFLDIDGVLNCDRTLIGLSGDRPIIDLDEELVKTIDPVAVGLLNNLTLKAKAKIVMSSSHRSFFRIKKSYKDYNLTDLRSYVARLGVKGEIIGATPDLNHHPTIIRSFQKNKRGIEINLWLDHWISRGNILGRYLILDDSPDILDKQLDNFVQTCRINGFLTEHFYKACTILGVPFGASNYS